MEAAAASISSFGRAIRSNALKRRDGMSWANIRVSRQRKDRIIIQSVSCFSRWVEFLDELHSLPSRINSIPLERATFFAPSFADSRELRQIEDTDRCVGLRLAESQVTIPEAF
jgi:hypothetical protein